MSKNEVHKCKIYSYSFSYCIVMILIKLLARNQYGTLLMIAIFHSKAGSLWLYNLKSYRLPCYSHELILSLTDLGEYQLMTGIDLGTEGPDFAFVYLQCFLLTQPKPQNLKNCTVKKKLEQSHDTWVTLLQEPK